MQWLRDGLGIIAEAAETEALAASLESNDGVYFVPALTGLGSPHWDPYARGTIVGLTRGTGRAHLARAALEAIAYQTVDAVRAQEAASGESSRRCKADGGAVANAWLMQFQADVLGAPVIVPEVAETTALGAAYLAGIATGPGPPRRSARVARGGRATSRGCRRRARRCSAAGAGARAFARLGARRRLTGRNPGDRGVGISTYADPTALRRRDAKVNPRHQATGLQGSATGGVLRRYHRWARTRRRLGLRPRPGHPHAIPRSSSTAPGAIAPRTFPRPAR